MCPSRAGNRSNHSELFMAFKRINRTLCAAGLMGGLMGGLLSACGGDDNTLAPPASATSNERATALLAQMTQDEKLQLVRGWSICGVGFSARGSGLKGPGYIPGIARLGIPDLNMTDGGAGISDCSSVSAPFSPRINAEATALPAPVALAATWDTELAYAYGALLGTEARAQGFNMVLGGSVGLLRDPRLGRAFEYMGEDPLLSGLMVTPKIQGAQAQHVVMSLKHLAVNQQETSRDTSNSVVDERSLRELYLSHFETAVKEAKPGSVMCAYNKLNGDWACENDWLLNTVLKGEWGFKGWVQSDWGATHSTVKAALAGLDEEQYRPTYFGAALSAAVAASSVPQSRLDDMVKRKLVAMIDNGLLDHPPVAQPIDFDAGAALAQQVAGQSMVLLKNSDALLPFAKTTARIAVIGKHADAAMLTGGGSSQVLSPGGPAYAHPARAGQACPNQPGPANWCEIWLRSAPLAALQAKAPGANVRFADGSDTAAAAALAADSDVVVLMAHQWASEGADAASLTLRDNQDALIAAVAAANPRTVVVLQTGNPVLMPWLPQVGAVVQSWYAGIRGAQALADLLFGDVNPSAKLPISFPATASATPTGGADLAGGDVRYTEGLQVGYRWYDARGVAPLFAFGHGLSYTTYAYTAVQVASDGSAISFTVTNTGTRSGTEIAQVYASLPSSVGDAPKRLVGWKKVVLAAGASQRVTVPVARERLRYWHTASAGWKVAPGTYQFMVGASSRDIRLQDATPLQ
jgi:beta-glucosidase